MGNRKIEWLSPVQILAHRIVRYDDMVVAFSHQLKVVCYVMDTWNFVVKRGARGFVELGET